MCLQKGGEDGNEKIAGGVEQIYIIG